MPTHNHEFVTQSEFSRWVSDWRTEESNFRARLEGRLAEQHREVKDNLATITTIVRETNGAGRKNAEAILVMRRDLDALIAEDQEIDRAVHNIERQGCAQLREHRAVLDTLGWSPRKKAAVAGGLVGTGALAWPAIQKIAELFHALVERQP